MQGDLFGNEPSDMPEGFRHAPGIVPEAMQQALLREITNLSFKTFDFHGFEGRRRVVSFGWKYDFDSAALRATEQMPAFLLPLRALAATFTGLPPERLQQALVTEYDVGAPIGWHRDKAVFGVVVGISLLSSCKFRLRRKAGGRWERFSINLEPGSIYVLSGPARTIWEHSIPPADSLRYSVTFRELASMSSSHAD